MDGEHKDCPIEPDNAIRYNYGPGEDDYLLIAPSHDSIQYFPDSKYNHLRYYDAEERQMRTVWLPSHVLADLADMGIPPTKRKSVTESEYEAYQTFLSRLALKGVVEVEEVEEQLALPPGDAIDAEVQRAAEHLDAEIDYYLREPGWGTNG